MLKIWLVIIIFLIMSSGCGIELKENVEKELDEAIVSVLSIEKPFLSFSWIEQGYNGVLEPLDTKLGQTEREIRELFGQPINEGNIEGGIFLEYKDATYFINPDTNKTVAMSIKMKRHQLTVEDLKRTLGTPDQSEFNEMEGRWIYIYELDHYELMFEAQTEHAVLSYAWLRDRLK